MRSMVKGYVRKAFALIGDLAEDVKFIDSGAVSFDYVEGVAVKSDPKETVMRAVVIRKILEDTNLSITKLLLMTEQFDLAGITSIDTIDKVVVRGHTLNIIHPKGRGPNDNGYTINLYASQEDV